MAKSTTHLAGAYRQPGVRVFRDEDGVGTLREASSAGDGSSHCPDRLYGDPGVRHPPGGDERFQLRWSGPQEQAADMAARVLLGILAFMVLEPSTTGPSAFPAMGWTASLMAYVGVSSALFWHNTMAASPVRPRLQTGLDVCVLSMATLQAPGEVPWLILLYPVIVLVTGLRHGLRPSIEAMLMSSAALALVAGLRPATDNPVTLHLILLGVLPLLLYIQVLLHGVASMRRRLMHASFRDGLTGLPNRSALEYMAGKLLRAAERTEQPLAVLLGDIDAFKQLNDHHGHPIGDRVLRRLGRILRSNIRDGDLACRYGGDEFLVLLPGSNARNAGRIADRVRRDLACWSTREGIPCSISIGVAEVPRHGKDLDTVVRHADKAMYREKRAGHRQPDNAVLKRNTATS